MMGRPEVTLMPASDDLAVAERLHEAHATHLSPEGGFLPPVVPLETLPAPFAPYLEACAELPERFPVARGGVRAWLADRFRDDEPAVAAAVDGLDEMGRAKLMTVLSLLCHAYRWESAPPAPEAQALRRLDLPAGLASPWRRVAALLGQPPVGTMWSLILSNWRMPGRPGGSAYRNGELVAENLSLAHEWLPPPHDVLLERWSLMFVESEARAAPVVKDLVAAVGAAAREDEQQTTYLLDKLYDDVAVMGHVFMRTLRVALIPPEPWADLIGPIYGWGLESDQGR